MDTEGKTQVISASAADKTKIVGAVPATRVAAAGKEKKSLMVPAAIAVVIVALGGGAWAVFGRGQTPPLSTPGQRDTTTRQTAGVPSGSDTNRLSHGDTTAKSTPKNPHQGGRTTGTTTRPPVSGDLDSTTLSGIADRIPDMQPPRAAYDSALLIYNAPRAGQTDRAFAACTVARYLKDNGKDAEAVQWARRGLALKSGQSACTTVLNPGGH
jgi:hypothetical protein